MVARLATLALVLSSLALAAPAAAQDGTIVKDGKNAQEIIFTDADQLKTSGLSPDASVVKGRPKGVRTILVRPRTTWVPELLKSIELL
jgi:hypothetical protein